jgi:DnaJ-class molecular chaperone
MNDRMTDLTSKYTAQKCPVCNSFGTLQYGKVTCHGCRGRGFIIIDNRTGMPVDPADVVGKEVKK